MMYKTRNPFIKILLTEKLQITNTSHVAI